MKKRVLLEPLLGLLITICFASSQAFADELLNRVADQMESMLSEHDGRLEREELDYTNTGLKLYQSDFFESLGDHHLTRSFNAEGEPQRTRLLNPDYYVEIRPDDQGGWAIEKLALAGSPDYEYAAARYQNVDPARMYCYSGKGFLPFMLRNANVVAKSELDDGTIQMLIEGPILDVLGNSPGESPASKFRSVLKIDPEKLRILEKYSINPQAPTSSHSANTDWTDGENGVPMKIIFGVMTVNAAENFKDDQLRPTGELQMTYSPKPEMTEEHARLSHYGLPEPALPSSGGRFLYIALIFGLVLIVIGWLFTRKETVTA